MKTYTLAQEDRQNTPTAVDWSVIDPYQTLYGPCTDLIFLKPRYFTDETSLQNFVAAASDERTYGNKCQVLVRMTSGQDISDETAIDKYANAALRERTRLQITFREANRSAVITFTAKTDKWGAATTITGTSRCIWISPPPVSGTQNPCVSSVGTAPHH